MTNLPSGAPNPSDEGSGVAGNQQPGLVNEVVSTPAPLGGGELVDTMRNMISGNPQHFGGMYAGPMLSAHLGDSHYNRMQAQLQIAELQRQLAEAKEAITDLRVTNVQMEERMAGAALRVWVQKLCAFSSPIAAGLAIEFNKNEVSSWKPLALLAGVLFLISVLPDLRRKR